MDQANDTFLINMDEIENVENDLQDEVYISKLLFCTSKGDVNALKEMFSKYKLKNKKWSYNDVDYDGRSCLHIAASTGCFDIVKYLVEQGANINIRDRFGGTPRDDAIRNGHADISNYLIQNGASKPAESFQLELIQACSQNNIEKVSRLLTHHVSPNCCDYDERTPLHLAVASKSYPLVSLLLEYNADPQAIDKFGGSPLSDAIRNKSRVGNDKIVELLKQKIKEKRTENNIENNITNNKNYFLIDLFILFNVIFEITCIFLYSFFGNYNFSFTDFDTSRYAFFKDVSIMMLIGFGFLMTFLKKFGYSSLTMTFYITCLVVQIYPFYSSLFNYLFNANSLFQFNLNIETLIKCNFATASVLITLGVLLGKINMKQIIILCIFETLFYSLNEQISIKLNIIDGGGSMIIHTFGAFFGLACSKMLYNIDIENHINNSAVYHSDMFAMIGTLFLWIYWPSFNSALVTNNQDLIITVVNTYLSLVGSCVSCILFSYILRHERKLCMVDIQNATLAGGVAIGSCSGLNIHPITSLSIGLFAGFISVFGYTTVQSRLESSFNIYDTCGVFNLHGIPGIFGGICSIIAVSIISTISTPLLQLSYLIITILISCVTGILTGYILKLLENTSDTTITNTLFADINYFEVPKLETPYYFDIRGEVEHKKTG
jgi:ammonium transporter Rh